MLPGGTITVAGNIKAASGAKLDVSGTSGTLDLSPSYSALGLGTNGTPSGTATVATRVESDGGAITFTGGQEMFVDATLLGAAGGSSAAGGSLTLSSGRFYPAGTSAGAQTPLDVTLTVTQSGTAPAGSAGHGFFAADTFNRGFDSLTLKGTVQLAGPVTLVAPARISVSDAGFITADATVNLSAPEVALGAPFQTPLLAQELGSAFLVQGQPIYAPPVSGAGARNVSAKLIDVGNLSLQNIGNASLTAVDGDIRGNGTLELAGDLTLRAGQVYVPLAVAFTIAAFDSANCPGSITVVGSGNRQTPLSAGGELNLFASTLTQGGTLRAPIGTINLGWSSAGTAPKDLISNQNFPATQQLTLTPGSITSVSAVDPVSGQALTIPYGVNLNGTSWIDPTSLDITVNGVPAKSVNLCATNVTD